ncbi:conserved hypothetical protein [Streptomyces himastatinicus ATCC 53653]|uniref:Uncharacterized protein n=1 Tax=Streptomyces himastatinicus ATCC 53653 TaxID=457427 RepID=D9WED8_9ACTN|nr:conserved hypothetical protein [Streptomyces himastatinicus ATCC 53653]
MRFAVALGGECPHQAHLPALTEDHPHADAALGELLAHGLVTTVGPHYRLAAGVAAQLAADGYAGDAAESAGRAHTVAQHYTWWAGHPSVAPERVAVEADAILAAMAALVADRESGHADAAVALARAAAPAFAAALHWGAWERAVRHGQEAARLAGQVADEAYFHHELGVLALCTGNLDRARAELEASIGLRGALADKSGMVAGRRALALVSDRKGAAMTNAFGPGVVRPSTEEPEPTPTPVPGENATTTITPVVAETTKIPPVAPVAPVAATAALPTPPPAASPPAKRGPKVLRGLAPTGARRNLAAAGAGALLVAVLGTVVTLGALGDDDGKDSPDRVKPRESASQQDDDKDLTADEPSDTPGQQTPRPGLSNVPLSSPSSAPTNSGSPSGSTGPTDPSTSGDPSQPQSPSAPSSQPTTNEPTHEPTNTPTTRPTPPTTPPTHAPTNTPTTEPTSPTNTASNTAGGPPPSNGAPTPPSTAATA